MPTAGFLFMYTSHLNIYKLLALSCAVKRYRRNSVIYAHEKRYIVARELGLSPITLGKHIEACIRAGIAHKTLSGHIVFIGLKQAIIKLFGGLYNDVHKLLKDWKHKRFFKEFNISTFREFQDRIGLSILAQNIGRQDHKRRTDRNQRGIIKSTEKRGVTGKSHIAGLLGCSPATGLRRLRKWSLKGLIKRVVKKKLYLNHKLNGERVNLEGKNLFIVSGIITEFFGSEIIFNHCKK